MTDEETVRNEICRYCRHFHERGLVVGSAGNISVRHSPDRILITPTGASFAEMKPDDLSEIDTSGVHISGSKPSKEEFFHRAMLNARPNDHAVVHLHSRACVAFSCMQDVDENDVIPALTPYFVMRVGHVRLVPYAPPGDDRLYGPIFETAKSTAAVLIENHGPVISGKTLQSAVAAAEELEETAHLALLLNGQKVKVLGNKQIAELQQRFDVPGSTAS